MAYTIGKAFFLVAFGLLVITLLVFSGGFDAAKTETGLKHYAERKSPFLKSLLPKWVKMPLNTAVNIGYLIFGAYWCAVVFAMQCRSDIRESEALLFYVFNIMACFYGPVQTLRILIDKHRFAILDQWVTLPFFMWVFVWSLSYRGKYNIYVAYVVMCASISSYVLTLYTPIGFEFSLGLHIWCAMSGALLVYRTYRTSNAHWPFLGAMLSCSGFVILKLLDLYLPTIHPMFTHISGHFLSKIADVLQIHFVNRYFMSILKEKYIQDEKKKH